jgi:hypothetical protein
MLITWSPFSHFFRTFWGPIFGSLEIPRQDQIQERHDNAEAREKRLLDEAGKVIQRAESLQGVAWWRAAEMGDVSTTNCLSWFIIVLKSMYLYINYKYMFLIVFVYVFMCSFICLFVSTCLNMSTYKYILNSYVNNYSVCVCKRWRWVFTWETFTVDPRQHPRPSRQGRRWLDGSSVWWSRWSWATPPVSSNVAGKSLWKMKLWMGKSSFYFIYCIYIYIYIWGCSSKYCTSN